MPTISLANFLALADSLAQQARTIYDAFTSGAIAAGEPVSGTGMGSGPANNKGTITGANDIDVEAALSLAFQPAIAPGSLLSSLYAGRLAALDRHVGGIGSFLSTNNARVDPHFRDLLWRVPAAQVFPPVVDPMATFSVTGAGAGTFTQSASIDTTKYGPAALQVVTTAAIGASTITATLTLQKLDGSTATKTVTIPNATANGTTFAVDGGAIAYVAVTAITISGGTAGDAFKVRSLLERTIAL